MANLIYAAVTENCQEDYNNNRLRAIFTNESERDQHSYIDSSW